MQTGLAMIRLSVVLVISGSLINALRLLLLGPTRATARLGKHSCEALKGVVSGVHARILNTFIQEIARFFLKLSQNN